MGRFGTGGKRLVWVVFAFILIQQSCGPYWTDLARARLLTRFQNERQSRVIAMIHRQETVSLLGVPVSSYIDIEDSEAVLRAIRLTPEDQPIDLILHTPGGLVLAAEQIANALVEHKGKVTDGPLSSGRNQQALCALRPAPPCGRGTRRIAEIITRFT